MTLRVELSIIPFGDETKKRVIETFNISNISMLETFPQQQDDDDLYVVEHNTYKKYDDDSYRLLHKRKHGAIELAAKVLSYFSR